MVTISTVGTLCSLPPPFPPPTAVAVSLTEDSYNVMENSTIEVCASLNGMIEREVTVDLETRNLTADCKRYHSSNCWLSLAKYFSL